MTLRELPSRLNRLQHGLPFKVIASIIVAVLCIAYASWQAVNAADQALQPIQVQNLPDLEQMEADPDSQAEAAEIRAYLASIRGLNELRARSGDWTAHVAGAGVVLVLMLAIIWLGLGLTALGLWGVLTIVVAPLWLIGISLPASVPLGRTLKAAAFFLYALGALTFAFSVLMTLLRLLFSAPSRVLAIARNVAMEAVRLKVSLVFIVLLMFALAALPGLLDAETPLRYRVQAFLQYGVGGAFWIIAILTVFLAVGTVAFEQRDRIIWQTATKPVAAWEYLLGKWLGVVGVGAVMLAVSGSGIFLFTEYLRNQPAVGEVAAFVPANPNQVLTEDRRVLETQVLAARRLVLPNTLDWNEEEMNRRVEQRVQAAAASDPLFRDTREARAQLRRELEDEARASYLSVPPPPPDRPDLFGQSEAYVFSGLSGPREDGRLLTLRYQVNVGANDPRTTYRIAIKFGDMPPMLRTIAVGQTLNEQVPSAAVYPNGDLVVWFLNGGDTDPTNPSETMSFPPDGLQVFYAVGSYRLNYVRIFGVLLLKLGFLAMIGVVCATFLSFSVASLVSFGTFLIAESSGYLLQSLEYYNTTDRENNIILHKLLVKVIAQPISMAFRFYSDLKLTSNLVEGRLVGWLTVLQAGFLFGILCLLLYLIGVIIFRRRELATYSGN